MLGDWDTADDVLAELVDFEMPEGGETITYCRAWLAGLRGDDIAETVLASLATRVMIWVTLQRLKRCSLS